MRYFEIINEGRDAPLYHGTGFYNAIEMIKRDRIEARTSHFAPQLGMLRQMQIPGVSLSRSRTVAFEFGPAVLVLDQRKLVQTHKLVPIEYWWHPERSSDIPSKRSKGNTIEDQGTEAEEFCIGEIKPLTRFLISILMEQKSLRALKNQLSWTDVATEPLLKHPLLKIIKDI